MRIKNLVLGEFLFVYKYGIVFLYFIFTMVYICFLTAVPVSARGIAITILVFTDPAAMGLFFMGAVVLFEKSQRVESSLGVSPIKISEYIFAKVIPLMLIGVIVSMILCLFFEKKGIGLVMIGVGLASTLFSFCGLMVGSNIKTLNGFMIATVPFEIILCIPALLFLFGVIKSKLWILHPGVAAINLIKADTDWWFLSVLSIVVWMIPSYFACKKAVTRNFCSMGGIKL